VENPVPLNILPANTISPSSNAPVALLFPRLKKQAREAASRATNRVAALLLFLPSEQGYLTICHF
jgi:hypothetical protein